MEENLALKMFNCSNCGPKETCLIRGEWVDKDTYKDMVFEMTRPSFETFNASMSDRSMVRPNGPEQPRILAEVETYAENIRKFQCPSCGKIFVISKKIHNDSATVSGGAAVLQGTQPPSQGFAFVGALPNPSVSWPANPVAQSQVLEQLFDSKFTEAELDTILFEVGEDPVNYTSKSDKITGILDRLS